AIAEWGTLTDKQAQSCRFYADAAKTIELPREVVNANEIYVMKDLTNADFIFAAYDGKRNDYAATDPFGGQNVWGNDYSSVIHMQDNANDSTANGISGINSGGAFVDGG